VFNLSIDPPDLLKNIDGDPELEEDLSINEIESFSELVLEQGFELENAVPETDDPDSDNLIKKVEIFSYENQLENFRFPLFDSDSKALFFYDNSGFVPIGLEVLNPPPEV
ncbi:MAG: hypothetical protein K2Q22_12580, partial [Cytophagales bacterium]|nr:hypothetical protein [Cytophagales bacterium]